MGPEGGLLGAGSDLMILLPLSQYYQDNFWLLFDSKLQGGEGVLGPLPVPPPSTHSPFLASPNALLTPPAALSLLFLLSFLGPVV